MFQGMQQTSSMRQSQVLAPQMRQGLDILQMTALDLRAELQRQMELNPVIEDVTSRMEKPLSSELPEEHVSGAISERELDFSPTGEAAQQTLSCDDADRDYFLANMENFQPTPDSGAVDADAQTRRQQFFDRQVKSDTLQEHLQKQLALSDVPAENRPLAEMLIASIDDDGYFRGSLPDIQMIAQARQEQILETLQHISKLDPLGCGGRNLRECLLFQMEKLDDSPWEDEVRKLIDRHLEDAALHREALICQDLGIASADYAKVLSELKKLDPHPGRGYSPNPEPSIYVRPEVFVKKNASGHWTAFVTDRDLPELHISKKYEKMLEDPNCSAETKSYIRERIRAARILIDSIDKRQTTIQRIAQAIVDAQQDVFNDRTLASLHPLTMEQIAQETSLHNATISRTVREKYMSTPLGLVEMRRFFVAGLKKDDGNVISNTAIKDRIRKLIDSEDKTQPLSDDRIVKLLDADGIKCARRTVTKYRESMHIPGTTARRVK